MASSGRIDVHAHCVPPEWQAVPAASAPLFRGFTSWSIHSALEMMDRQGIATAVLSMVFWSGLFADADDVAAARRLARSSNEVAAEAVRSHRTALAASPASRCPMWTAPWPRSTKAGVTGKDDLKAKAAGALRRLQKLPATRPCLLRRPTPALHHRRRDSLKNHSSCLPTNDLLGNPAE